MKPETATAAAKSTLSSMKQKPNDTIAKGLSFDLEKS